MTVPFYCLIIAMLLLVITKAPVALAMHQLGGYNNKLPRVQQQKLKGWGLRALAAHKNEREAFPIFLAGVMISHLASGDPIWAARLAAIYIVARCVYVCLYIANLDILRSLVWSTGYGCSILLALWPILKP